MRRAERYLWTVVVALAIGDIILTDVAISLGAVEQNEVMRDLVETHGMAGMAVVKVACIGICASLRPALPVDYRPMIPGLISLPWAGAVAINSYVVLALA